MILTSTRYSPSRGSMILSLIFLLASLLAIFSFFEMSISFIIFLAVYCTFSAIFTILLYICKIWLMNLYFSENAKRISVRPILIIYFTLLFSSLMILFLIPNLWLSFICGLVTGSSLSELIAYYLNKSNEESIKDRAISLD